jgi:hypothetical protein
LKVVGTVFGRSVNVCSKRVFHTLTKMQCLWLAL